jgi:hypothetical protein
VSLLTNKEAIAINKDVYGLQPIKVDEPATGIQIWVKPMAIAGRRAIGILNRNEAGSQVNIYWEKLGLKGTPRSIRDVWSGRNLNSADLAFSVPPKDLTIMVVDGEYKSPEEYPAKQDMNTGIQATRGPTFARLQYINSSGHAVVVPVKSTSGFVTALNLPPTVEAETGAIGVILPHGTADLLFERQPVEIRKLEVYVW